MNKAIAFGGAFALLFLLTTVVPANGGGTAPAWLLLTRAYPSRNDKLINHYTKSDITSVRLYAQALKALSTGNWTRLVHSGKKCANAQPRTDADSAAYFGCLFAVSTGLGIAGRTRDSFLWTAKTIDFYKNHRSSIDDATGSNNPANIQGISIPTVADIKNWPKPEATVKKHWHNIKLHHGTINAYIDGTPIALTVDTAATAITLSPNAISHYALTSDLMPLHARFGGLDSTNGYHANLYYVKKFRVGPITIYNAYVSVYPGSEPLIGIDVLRLLKRFTISSTEITPVAVTQNPTCGEMLFTRADVTQAVQYPFFKVPTTIGRIGLMLDSGLHMSGPFSTAGLHLAPREQARLKAEGRLEGARALSSVLTQNGKRMRSKTEIFPFSVAGVRTEAYVSIKDPSDPLLAGAMDFAILKKANVTYDFSNAEMCIGAIRSPGSTGSGLLSGKRAIGLIGEAFGVRPNGMNQ